MCVFVLIVGVCIVICGLPPHWRMRLRRTMVKTRKTIRKRSCKGRRRRKRDEDEEKDEDEEWEWREEEGGGGTTRYH